MSKFCCITDLIRFIMKESENLMKGSVHEDDFFIVNDDLVLMTVKETIERMKKKNCSQSFVAAHEWIAGRDNLCWTPCR